MARQRHPGLKEQYCPICNQTYPAGTRTFSEEHIVPYALGNRKWVVPICKDCNLRLNANDEQFVKLEDIKLGRMEFDHRDRKNKKVESRMETRFDLAGLDITARTSWDGQGFVVHVPPRIHRQYGNGELFHFSNRPLTEKDRRDLEDDLQKRIQRRQISAVLPTASSLLYLPNPQQPTHMTGVVHIQDPSDVRIKAVLKVLLESLSSHCNPRFNELSFVPLVRELLFLEGDRAFVNRLHQLELEGVYVYYQYLLKIPVATGVNHLQEFMHGARSQHFERHPLDLEGLFEQVMGRADTYEQHQFVLQTTEMDFGQGERPCMVFWFVYYGYFYGMLFFPLTAADLDVLNGEPFRYADQVDIRGAHRVLHVEVPAALQKTARKK